MNDEKRLWGIHMLDDFLFLHENVFAIGWSDMGNLLSIENTRETFKTKYVKFTLMQKKDL